MLIGNVCTLLAVLNEAHWRLRQFHNSKQCPSASFLRVKLLQLSLPKCFIIPDKWLHQTFLYKIPDRAWLPCWRPSFDGLNEKGLKHSFDWQYRCEEQQHGQDFEPICAKCKLSDSVTTHGAHAISEMSLADMLLVGVLDLFC